MNRISFEVKKDIAYVGFGYNCDKSMTVIDEETIIELGKIVDEVKEKNDLKACIFFTHKEKCFLAGADIKLIDTLKTEEDASKASESGQNLFNKIEDLKIPTISLVNGVCLGGGTELVLATNTILMSDTNSSIMGLPEVKLGLIPGFGGTYRLPKRVGLPNALDMILTGKNIKPKKAKKMGLIEEYYPKERLLDMALKKHLKIKKKDQSLKNSLTELASDNFLTRKIIFQKARETVMSKTKGHYIAPLKILETMENGSSKSRKAYLKLEAMSFGFLCSGVQSQNLRHIFFLTEIVKKYNGPTFDGKARKLKNGATLGAGTMGGGIAWLMASQSMNPIMKDLNSKALELGLKQASINFSAGLKRRKITKEKFQGLMRSIRPQTNFDGFKSVDLVIEAIIEDISIKKSVFKELEDHVSNETIIASNTSSLSVNEMSKALKKSDRFAGLHFFNPVNKMPLVEIITHDSVSSQTLKELHAWVIQTKKTPIIVKDGPGFLVNRILVPYLNEAGFLLEEGVGIEEMDKALLNFGMPMGPCHLLDEVGLDVGSKVAKILFEGLGDRMKNSTISHKLIDKKFLGRKTSKGFYIYDEKGKKGEINPDVLSLLPNKKSSMSEKEIQQRLILPMINEAAQILNDKIVSEAWEVDLGMIFGTGFPPFRGGLLKYADSEGLHSIVESLKLLAEKVDNYRYSPCEFLVNLDESKKNFYDV